MNYVELVNEIFQVCIVPLLGILTTYLVKYISIKMEEIQVKTENEKIQRYDATCAKYLCLFLLFYFVLFTNV